MRAFDTELLICSKSAPACCCRWKVGHLLQQGLLFSHIQQYQLDRSGEAIQLVSSET